MGIQQRLNKANLIDPNDCFDIIGDLNPHLCSQEDVTTLLRIRKIRPNDKLAFLGLEADAWLRKNLKILKKRFT